MRYLLDLSAWAHAGHPAVRQRWQNLLASDSLVCHPVFALELLHTSKRPADYVELRAELDDALDWIWPDEDTASVALTLQQRMATGGACGHRVKTPDLLIAALAVQRDLGVLHYDEDYDAIRARAGESFASKWLAERGSLGSRAGRRRDRRRAFQKAVGERMVQLTDDRDLDVWPQVIALLDEQLRAHGLPLPPPPA
jgi:predicted nucleic acid-binding protein